jgi:hypothetical protein
MGDSDSAARVRRPLRRCDGSGRRTADSEGAATLSDFRRVEPEPGPGHRAGAGLARARAAALQVDTDSARTCGTQAAATDAAGGGVRVTVDS